MFGTSVLLYLCVSVAASGQVYQPPPPEAEHPIAAIETYELPQPNEPDKLQMRITYPSDSQPADSNFRGYPVIIWSHGLGGSKETYAPLVRYWASHGYVVIQPTHDDSISKLSADERREIRNRTDLWALTKSWSDRPKQIALIIDALEKIEKDNPALAGRMDGKHIGVGGHSFGAHTTMMVAGFTLHGPLGGRSVQLADARPIVFVAISPQGPGPAVDEKSYQPMTRPMLMITGTHDGNVLNPSQDSAWRMDAWKFTPAGDKYLLWVNDAHHGFGGIAGKVRYSGAGPENDKQVEIVKTTALAMWDAWLKDDAKAKQWLRDAGELRDGEQEAKVSRK